MRGYPTIDTPVRIHRYDYKGRAITAPYKVSTHHMGPGYTIDGSILESGFAPNHVATALEPDQPKQKHRSWNGYVLYGWRTKREAEKAMAKHLGVTLKKKAAKTYWVRNRPFSEELQVVSRRPVDSYAWLKVQATTSEQARLMARAKDPPKTGEDVEKMRERLGHGKYAIVDELATDVKKLLK